MNDDNELLRRFVQDGSDSAFSELVSRHLPLVYSAAIRQSAGNTQTAQDIVQTVFIELARHAKTLLKHESIIGWLYTSVRFAASKARRAELRRQNRERLAVMNQNSEPDTNPWDHIAPVLDDAIAELNPEDRAAIIHRFLKGSDFRQVGAVLGVTEDAARMRVTRAVEKLHNLLTQRGATLAASALAALLTAKSIVAAPSGFESQIKNLGFRSAATGAGTSTLFLLQLLRSNWKWMFPTAALLFLAANFYLKQSSIESLSSQKSAMAAAMVASEMEAATTPSTSASDSPATQAEAKSDYMPFKAIDDATGAPLPGVKLRFVRFPRTGSSIVNHFETDAEGSAQIPKVSYPESVNLFATAAGHVPLVISWRRGMPDEYTMKMPPGIRIGGVVVDESKQPKSGVTIDFGDRGHESRLRENIQFGVGTEQVSDDQGRWSSDMIPQDLQTIHVLLTHPDFANTQTNVSPATHDVTNLVLVMNSGVEISGVVNDSDGQPVPNVSVKEIRDNGDRRLSTKTDQAGQFRLMHAPAEEMILSFLPEAKPLAPAIRELSVSNQPVFLQITLEPGHLLRGRIVDENNVPITNAVARTTFDSEGRKKIDWSSKTDASGLFEWLGAPAEPLLYSFSAENFSAFSRPLNADGSIHEIQLKRLPPIEEIQPITVTGTVTDEQTGQPLDSFSVLLADDISPGPRFESEADGRSGKFKLLLDRSTPAFILQLEAKGYETIISSNIFTKDGDQALQFQMRKSKGFFGLVLAADSTPLSSADVFLYDERTGVYLDQPPRARNGNPTSARHSKSDEEGRFAFDQIGAGLGLIAVHEFGYAEIPLAEFQSHVILQPWGRVEGRLLNAGRPMPNERIGISNFNLRYRDDGRRSSPLSLSLETTTDAQGRFVFENVPPGERIVRHWIKKPGKQLGRIYQGRELPFLVKPGQTTRIDLGGQGAAVTGRVSLPSDQSIDWQTTPVELRLKVPTAIGDFPRPNAFPNRDAYAAARANYTSADRSFWSSPEGQEATRARRNYWTFCTSDGTFTFHDLPPGDYELEIELRPQLSSIAPASSMLEPPAIASLSTPVRIPSTESKIDLGVLSLTPTANAK